MKRPLTAQEALDRYGHVPYFSAMALPVPSVQESGPGVLEDGTRLTLIGELSRDEAKQICIDCGWTTYICDYATHFYKAVAK